MCNLTCPTTTLYVISSAPLSPASYTRGLDARGFAHSFHPCTADGTLGARDPGHLPFRSSRELRFLPRAGGLGHRRTGSFLGSAFRWLLYGISLFHTLTYAHSHKLSQLLSISTSLKQPHPLSLPFPVARSISSILYIKLYI